MLTMLNAEMESILQKMQETEPGTEAYSELEKQLGELQKILHSREEMALAAGKQNIELSLKEEDLNLRKKESRRGIFKVLLAGGLAIGQVIVLANLEELKPLVGRAWGFVTKPRL